MDAEDAVFANDLVLLPRVDDKAEPAQSVPKPVLLASEADQARLEQILYSAVEPLVMLRILAIDILVTLHLDAKMQCSRPD